MMQSQLKVSDHNDSILDLKLNQIKNVISLDEIAQLVSTYNNLLHRTNELINIGTKQRKAAIMGEVASQVAHDIRSPLAALEMVNEELSALPEDLRLLVRNAVGRIKDISNNLLESNRKASSKTPTPDASAPSFDIDAKTFVALLSSLIDPLISEKRLQFRSKLGIEISANLCSSYGLFAEIEPIEFKRILSNLINNALEAMGDQGKITLTVTENLKKIEIRCADDAKGIPPEILQKLGQRGETHGKEGGSGLGLYHARTSVEKWGGHLKVESELNQGTSVIISLPKSPAPHWFVPELLVPERSNVVVLDDDSSIHQIWNGRFEKILRPAHQVVLKHCSTSQELVDWVHTQKAPTHAIYLVDYELLGDSKTGLDVIEDLGIGDKAILVTSRFEEDSIRIRCEHLGVKLIPKGLAAFVPILIQECMPQDRMVQNRIAVSPPVQAVFIDDSALNCKMWERTANRAGVSLLTFNDPDELLKIAHQLDLSTLLFFDSELADEKKGEIESKKFYDLGFRNIYLTTGHEPEFFPELPWIKEILGKSFPKQLFKAPS